jgi:hypothetical protein
MTKDTMSKTESAAAPAEATKAPAKAAKAAKSAKPPPKATAHLAVQSAATQAGSGPTVDQIEEMLEQLDVMASQFGVAEPLSIADRRRLLKIRPGGSDQATTVVGLTTRYGLSIPGVSSAQVTSDVALAKNLDPLISRFETMLGLATDASLGAKSRVWNSATKAYTMLVRLVPDYPALQRELLPMASLLASKHKDAPTSLRTQEKASLEKSRDARKASGGATAKKGASAAAASAPADAEPGADAVVVTSPQASPQGAAKTTAN